MYIAFQILLIDLKLTNCIDWSWFYVLLPLIVDAIKVITYIIYKLIKK